MEPKICEIHQKELKQGKGGSWVCATPVKKDSKGNVLEWCETRYFEEPPEVKKFAKKAEQNTETQFLMDVWQRIEERLGEIVELLKNK